MNRKYQIMGIGMLKNYSKYFSHYIIKVVGFILIHYAINLDIVSSFIGFSNFYHESIDLLQV